MAIRIAKKGKQPVGGIMAIMAGGAIAAGVMLTPAGLIETAATASGLPAILPAAAPPLGDTARLILAFSSGIGGMAMVAGLSAVIGRIGRRKASSAIRIGYDIGYEDDIDAPGFDPAGFDAGSERRRPLFASSELADVAPLTTADGPTTTDGLRLPVAPEALDDDELELDDAMALAPEPSPALRSPAPEMPFDPSSPVDDPAGIVASLRAEPADYSALSITELVNRFEHGLNQRRRLVADAVAARKAQEADAQARAAWLEPARIVPAPTVEPDRKSIDAEVDEALRAALGTLRKMTARAA